MDLLNLYNEPECWICRLFCDWADGSLTVGTGFLVNLRDSSKHCIMTAGHNIFHVEKGRVKKIRVDFPEGQKWEATSAQCFVSKSYESNPNETNDADDFGLIVTEVGEGLTQRGGFAFSILTPREDLNELEIFAFGYPEGGALQGNSSRLERDKLDSKPKQLFHTVGTRPGVSGGPIWIKHRDGYETAIGIHNYGGSSANKDPAKRATRLTIEVIHEMILWIGDCRLGQSIESSQLSGTFLKASTGSTPVPLSRHGRDNYTGFDFIPIEAPPYLVREAEGRELKYLYAISPTASKSPVYLRYDVDNIKQITFIKASENNSLDTEESGSTSRFSCSQKVKSLKTFTERETRKKSTGAWQISPNGTNLLLRIRLTSNRSECGCLVESGEVDFIPSDKPKDIKAGSALFLSSNAE